MKSRKHFFPPVTGGSSLLVIFAVLCLTIFGLLSLSTAQANLRLTNASVKAVTQYYEADQEAEAIFSRLRRGQIPEQVSVQNNIYTYKCTISDTQELQIVLSCENNVWSVLSWQAVTIDKSNES